MPINDDTSVFCADIGTEARGKFGWCGVTPSFRPMQGSRIDPFIDYIVEALSKHPKIAIGFEAPMFVPMRDDSSTLLNQRAGEAGSPFSAGAGPPVLVAALVQIPYILASLKARLERRPTIYFDVAEFRNAKEGVFFWEAFVSGDVKNPDSDFPDEFDANLAALTFCRNYDVLEEKNAISEPSVLNIVGAALIRTGWTDDTAVLGKPMLVLRAENEAAR